MIQLFSITALVFFGVALLNVFLNTLNKVATVNGTAIQAALMSALTFGFYTIVIKQIAAVDIAIVLPMTIIANLIGTYFAKWLLIKLKKDKLWRISCTIPNDKISSKAIIVKGLEDYNIGYNIMTYDDGCIIDIFSYTQAESNLIKEIFGKTENKIKYTIVSVEKSL